MVIFMTEWVDSDVLNWVGMLRFRQPEDLPHDETPFSRWVTLEEYLTRQPRYEEIDIFFARIFNKMMQFFNAKSISNAL